MMTQICNSHVRALFLFIFLQNLKFSPYIAESSPSVVYKGEKLSSYFRVWTENGPTFNCYCKMFSYMIKSLYILPQGLL